MARGGLAIRTTILLAILLTISNASALEPIHIGSGRDGSVINLDGGARQEGVVPYFSTSGFAAPRSPQVMEVDPGAMVHQSKVYRDATEDIYMRSSEILNRTALLAGDVEQNWMKVDESTKKASELQAMAKQSADDSKASANSSFNDALKARGYLDGTSALHNKTMEIAKRMDALADRIYQLENQTKADAERSSKSAQLAESYLDEIKSMRYELNCLMQE